MTTLTPLFGGSAAGAALAAVGGTMDSPLITGIGVLSVALLAGAIVLAARTNELPVDASLQ
ncbi:hypothetical protein [Halosegnis longus]|uniref:Uncharacterized protein n=1 Tax=Halosegnis longus TaxID=2216012 RepID=A0AAJ4R9R8_9EURY|nr:MULTISPECIES: hypothetical protein [Halobacteriales]RNJ26929.1 hypothetical protein Nmn1133_09690 [Salella cibi]